MSSTLRSWSVMVHRGLTPGLVAVLVLAVLLGGCGSAAQSPGATCESVEEAAYPELETVAKQTLEGVSYKLQRHSTCESQGIPEANVIASVTSWTSRREANDHLTKRGWAKDGNGQLVSQDGAYNAQVGLAKEPTGPEFVDVYFWKP